MPHIIPYTIEQYNQALELKRQGYGSQRIAKILGLNSRGAVEGWINQNREPYYVSRKRIEACNSRVNVDRMRDMNRVTQPKACKISAELRTKKLPLNAKKPSRELGYVLGTLLGDG